MLPNVGRSVGVPSVALLGAKFSDNTIDTRRFPQITSSQLTRLLAEDTLHADERSFMRLLVAGLCP
jgi:hypothetical protein